jgi:four helix bundle protein
MKPLLSDRLVEFGGRVTSIVRRAPRDAGLDNVLRQLARSATSPAANYAEAREALSTRDYVHKMKICVKELRETLVWLRIAHGAEFRSNDLDPLIRECNELIAISVTCIRRAASR